MRKLTSAAPERNAQNTPPQPKKGTCFHKGEKNGKNGIIFLVFFFCVNQKSKRKFFMEFCSFWSQVLSKSRIAGSDGGLLLP